MANLAKIDTYTDLGNIVSFKDAIGLYFVMTLFLEGSVNCDDYPSGFDGYIPAEEVVSIYGDNFETPEAREPYFIKVHRCVVVGYPADVPCWPLPATQNEIENVPDMNNAKKFYKYIVYNYTSCKCGHSKTPPKLHKNLNSNEINDTEFKTKLPNNPVNKRSCKQLFCSKPQPRYMMHPRGMEAKAVERLILFKQCLPGCNATTKNEFMKTTMNHGGTHDIHFKTDEACTPYDIYMQATQRPGAGNLMMNPIITLPNSLKKTNRPSLSTEKTHDTESENGLLIYIASPQVSLAALILSVILVSIVIVDFNLYDRKKVLLYTVLNCRKDTKDKACPDCADRHQKVIEIV